MMSSLCMRGINSPLQSYWKSIRNTTQSLLRRLYPATFPYQMVCSVHRGEKKLKHSRLSDDPDRKTYAATNGEQAVTANNWLCWWLTQTASLEQSVISEYGNRLLTRALISICQVREHVMFASSLKRIMLWLIHRDGPSRICSSEVRRITAAGAEQWGSGTLPLRFQTFEGKHLYKCLNSLSAHWLSAAFLYTIDFQLEQVFTWPLQSHVGKSSLWMRESWR